MEVWRVFAEGEGLIIFDFGDKKTLFCEGVVCRCLGWVVEGGFIIISRKYFLFSPSLFL